LLVSDGQLKKTVGRISSFFHIERPISIRCDNTHAHVLDICNAVSSGITSGVVALEKCRLMAGRDPEARESALGVTTASPALHHALAATWGMTRRTASTPPVSISSKLYQTYKHEL
jgi:hypothetical protein